MSPYLICRKKKEQECRCCACDICLQYTTPAVAHSQYPLLVLWLWRAHAPAFKNKTQYDSRTDKSLLVADIFSTSTWH